MVRRQALVTCVALLALSGVASAHDLGASRFDAPIPLAYLLVGAGATVALTALWLGVTVESATRARPRRLATVAPALASALRLGGRTLFLAGFVLAVVAGLAGRQAPDAPALAFVWPVWVKGVGLLAMLAGSPWAVLSPWRAVYDGLCRLEGTDVALFDYPVWLGVWPALVGFLALVGVVENLTVVPRSPRATALVMAAYAGVMVLGGVAFGRAWFRNADAFAVLYRLFGRVAPLDVTRTDAGGYVVELRPPWRGCLSPLSGLGSAAFVVATVYTVSFDGFTNTPEFGTLRFDVVRAAGVGPAAAVLLYIAGFLGFVGLFVAVCRLVARVGPGTRRWSDVALAFAPTLLPISVAYELAHNYPYVAAGAARVAVAAWGALVAAPVDSLAPLGWLSVPAFWASQVLLVLVGHLVAVVAAHHVALDRRPSLAAARRAHLPLVLVMVGYTVLSLWIVSRPVAG